ncbi:MAG: tetratricopeptide repeat protein, partial [Acidobacteria bacterium]|nr:tetratricopeptide repeat protein [Acidobacteriota bacterium]
MRALLQFVFLMSALLRTSLHAQFDRASELAAAGESELAKGKYEEAVRHGSECATMSLAAGRTDQHIRCLTIAGRARVYQGKYAEALGVLQEAATLARAHLLQESEAAALIDVGSAQYYLGDYTNSFDAFHRALNIVERQRAQRWYPRMRQIVMANLAMIEQRLGHYLRALDMYRALEEGAASMRPSEIARLQSNIGALYRRLGDPYKAISRYEAAERLFAQQRDRDGEIGVATNRGIALALDIGDLSGALAAFERAARLATTSGNRREQAQATLYSSEALRRLGDLEKARTKAELALSIAEELKASEETWKALVSLGSIAEDAGKDDLAITHFRKAIQTIEKLRTGIAAITLRAGFLGDKIEAYDGAIRVLLRGHPDPEEIFHDLEQSRARSLRDRLKVALGNVARLRGQLNHGEALVEYWHSSDRVAALWITRQQATVIPMGSLSGRAVEDLISSLKSGSDQWESRARRIAQVLLDPLPLQGVSRIRVVADRRLQAIPFEALPLSAGGRLLVDHCEVSYLPAASLLAAGAAPRGWMPPWNRMLVAFAFGGAEPAKDLFDQSLPPLPGARSEVLAAAHALGGKAVLHLDEDNRKNYVNSSLAETPVLHFATHGVADHEDPDRSRLAFSTPANEVE